MPARPRGRRAKQSVRPEVQWTLDAITGAAAFVSNERLDILAANQLGLALYSEVYDGPVRPVNTVRFVFLDPRAEATFGDWDRRRERVGRHPALPAGGTRTTATSRTSSANSQHKARRFAPAGPRIRSAYTTPASSTSAIRSSATST